MLAFHARSWLVALVLLTVGCGGTLKDVPRVAAHEVEFGGLPMLSPPTVTLEVVDERPEAMRDNQAELEQTLQSVLADVLASGHLTVADGAPHHLTVRVREADESLRREYDAKRCVLLQGRLERTAGFFAEAAALGCHHVRHGFGFTVGGDISQAYRMALNELFRGLAQQLGRLPAEAFAAAPASADGEAPTNDSSALLSVRVQPAAAVVYVDGVRQALGDVSSLPLAAGEHRIVVSASGLPAQQRTIQVEAGQHLRLSVSLGAGEMQVTKRTSRGNYSYLWPAIVGGVVAGLTVGIVSSL